MATRGVSLALFNAIRALFETAERPLSTREIIDNLKLTSQGQNYDTIRKRVQRAIVYLEDEKVVRSVNRDSTQAGVEGRWVRVGRKKAAATTPNAQKSSGVDTVQAAMELAASFLPAAIYEQLAEPLQKIAPALQDSAARKLFRSRLVVVPREPTMLVPKIKPDVVTKVLEAVIVGKPILVIYNSRNKEREVSIYLHPLGLVVRDSTIYVVGKTDFASDVRHWALHRFTAVKDHKGPLQRPEGFSLTRWVTDWKMGDYSEAEKVSFWMDEKVAHHLNEMKLSSDQKISKPVRGRVRVDATVTISDEFTWWVLAFGPNIEIIGPKDLRGEIRKSLSEAVKNYRE
jgi:predicted DNA-binding transcriptional regulator YafY